MSFTMTKMKTFSSLSMTRLLSFMMMMMMMMATSVLAKKGVVIEGNTPPDFDPKHAPLKAIKFWEDFAKSEDDKVNQRRQLRSDNVERLLSSCTYDPPGGAPPRTFTGCYQCTLYFDALIGCTTGCARFQCEMYCPQLPGDCDGRRALQPLLPTDETILLEKSDTDLKAGRKCKLVPNGKEDAWSKARSTNPPPDGWDPDSTNVKVWLCQ